MLASAWAPSINAGLVEELLFRLALPAAIFAVIGNALVAALVSCVVFGGMHASGRGRRIGIFVFAAVLLFPIPGGREHPVAILAHALFDLGSLVLIPVAVYKMHRVG